jgi:4,5:9,10-diseco-3-hydroxy-5,9,17-trioxoandrosta-1(10),2-diene-4-oate hydrolase
MPHCDVYLFSQTGHWVQWERSAEFNAAVVAFARKHLDAGEKA